MVSKKEEQYRDKISGYIKRMLIKGHGKTQIRKVLVDSGWPKCIIDEEMKKTVVVKKKAKKKVHKTLNKGQIMLKGAISDINKELQSLQMTLHLLTLLKM